MKETLQTIIIVAIANGSLLALLAYLSKQLFERTLNMVFEKQLKAYQHELNLQAEIHKKQIELLNQKSLHSFSKLYDEQAGVIKEIYSNLVSIYDKTLCLIHHYNLLETNPELFEKYKLPQDGDQIRWGQYLQANTSERKENIVASEVHGASKEMLSNFRNNNTFAN